jgi:hypothetical protein
MAAVAGLNSEAVAAPLSMLAAGFEIIRRGLEITRGVKAALARAADRASWLDASSRAFQAAAHARSLSPAVEDRPGRWLGWLFDGLEMHLYTLVAALS